MATTANAKMSVSTKVSIRTKTEIRQRARILLAGEQPKNILFLHIPKTAGTSAMNYIQTCVGGRKSGNTVKLSEIVRGKAIDDGKLQRAKRARFCLGHISWSTVEQICQGRETYVFTVLRDPGQRLWSHYKFLNLDRVPRRSVPAEHVDLYEEVRNMSPLEFVSSEEPLLRHFTDNLMVRQLGGGMDDLSLSEIDGKQLLDAAMRNLTQLDYVGFVDTFDEDLQEIVKSIGLPPMKNVPRSNVSQPSLKNGDARASDFRQFESEVGSAIEPLVRWDQQLYDFARAEFRENKGQ